MNSNADGTDKNTDETSSAEADTNHQVLVNEEEQYCLWPGDKDVPAGWKSVFQGTHQACLDHVELVWTDMWPKSIRS